MYKFLKIFFCVFILLITPIALSCPESFQDLKLSTIQEIFSDPVNYERYSGQNGYISFVKKAPNINSMNYVFERVSEALEKKFKRLKWQQFQGSVKEFEDLRLKILDEKGNVKEDYLEMSGYADFAKEHYDSDMSKTFINVSAVLSKGDFKKLKWQQFHGSVKEFEGLRLKILDEKGNVREKYLEMSGYADFAKEHYDGNMQKAFTNVSAVLSKGEFKKLQWRKFQGSVKEFEGLRLKILDEEGNVREEYLEMSGYADFAKKHYNSDMSKAFQNVSAVLSKGEFKKLNWRKFQGSVKEFEDLRLKILDEKGNVKEDYLEMSGYADFAKEHYDSDMSKAFINVSSVLGGYWGMKKLGLGWKFFQGSVSEYENLIQLFLEYPIESLQGIGGQERVAKEIFEGHNRRTYTNVSALREMLLGSREAFTDLEWSPDL